MIPGINKIKSAALLLLLSLGAAACIREGSPDCVRGLYVCFVPENPGHDYPALVRSVDLYFYDPSGALAGAFNYLPEELRAQDKAALVEEFPAGTYTLVSIVNDVETYRTDHTERLETLQSQLLKEVSDEPLVDFFSGIRPVTVIQRESYAEEQTEIVKHNNHIRLELQFDGYQLPSGSTLSAHIEGNNGIYFHQNEAAPRECFRTYLPYHTQEDRNGTPVLFDFTVMRLWRAADLTLCLEEKDQAEQIVRTIRIIITDELAKVVDQGEYLYNTDKKLSFHDRFVLRITLGPDFIVLELMINDWAVIRGGVDV